MSELFGMPEETNTEKKKCRRWSKSESVNGITKSIEVREAENGFVITFNKYGRDESVKDSEYFDENKTYISKTNPLEGKEEDKEEEKDPFSLGNVDGAISQMLGGLGF